MQTLAEQLSPRARRLILRLLREHAAELDEFVRYTQSDDERADALNDLGFVKAVIAGLRGG